MASRTPVTIESSPPKVVYRAPSIAPDLISRTDGTKPAIPSSPELVSPSSFARPRAPLLKSGSRAQQVPAGANAGFASAANIWRAQEKMEDALAGETKEHRVEDSERKREEGTAHIKSTGKLARPKKISKARNESVMATTESEDAPLSEQPEKPSGAVPGKDARRSPRKEASRQDDSAPRRPSMDLSRYSFDADRTSERPDVTEKRAPTFRKPARKRPAKSTITGDAPAEKKPRKGKAKSEAIILDSDEAEEALMEEVPRRDVAHAKPREPFTNPIAPFKDDGNRGCSALEPAPTSKHNSAEQRAEKASVTSAYFAQPQPAVQQHHLSAPPPPSPATAPTEQPMEVDTGKTRLIDNTTVNANIEHALPPSDPAPRRRRSWTPAKNPSEDNTISLVNHELDEKLDQIPFAEMLGNFSYLQADAAPVQRVVSGEASTKRRRMELSNTTHAAPPNDSNDSPPKAAPKTIKKTSKAPKKAQTITALATAAFQPAVPQEPAQSTVSAFFTPRKETSGPPAAEQAAQEEVPIKAKKPRKPRAKAKTTDNVAGAAAPAKTAKPRSKPKAKVKFNPADYEPPLHSPSQARKEMKSQEFLFGTSSQLAAEESPDFIREIQLAVRQSEMMHDMPTGSQPPCTQINSSQLCDERSYAKVPTAPHGTCLSVEQAHRELWGVSARDAAGAKLAQETQDIVRNEPDVEVREHALQAVELARIDANIESAKALPKVPLPATSNEKLEEFVVETIDNTTALEEAGPRLPSVEPKASSLDEDWILLRSDDSEVLPQPAAIKSPERPAAVTSMLARRTALQALDANVSMTIQDPGTKLNTLGQTRPFSTGTLDCGTKRYSAEPLDPNHSAAFAPQSPSRGPGRPRKNSLQAKSPTASPARGPGRPRKATSPMSRPATSPARGRGRPRKDTSPKRALATSPARRPGRPRKATSPKGRPATSPARGPGRPRKDTSPRAAPAASLARGRGRPRKDTSPRTAPTTSPTRGRGRPRNETLPATRAPGSPVRGRGRPRKHALVEKTARTSPIRGAPQPLQPVARGSPDPASPKRPVGRPRKDKPESAAISPRLSCKDRSSKRRISASQPELGEEWTNIDEISDSDSPATPSPRRRRGSTSPARVRPLDFAYARSPSPKPKASTSGPFSMKPTDPAWLTVQEVIYPQILQTIKSAPSSNDMKVPSWHEKILLYDPIVLEDLTAWLNRQGLRTEIKRQKPKVKKTGRKRKDATPEVDEWEVVRDELKAWMVQKWCEDQGICCLWKEGLRGGVKARY